MLCTCNPIDQYAFSNKGCLKCSGEFHFDPVASRSLILTVFPVENDPGESSRPFLFLGMAERT
jgi:hypothetical protein